MSEQATLKVKCKTEPIGESGKVMAFTKGNSYELVQDDEGNYQVVSDNGKVETFFDINIIFELDQS